MKNPSPVAHSIFSVTVTPSFKGLWEATAFPSILWFPKLNGDASYCLYACLISSSISQRLIWCCSESLLKIYPRRGAIPIVPHSVCWEEWRGCREQIARFWESPSLGLSHLDLAVELMDLILTRGCRSVCGGWASPVPTGLVTPWGWQCCAALGQHRKALLEHMHDKDFHQDYVCVEPPYLISWEKIQTYRRTPG